MKSTVQSKKTFSESSTYFNQEKQQDNVNDDLNGVIKSKIEENYEHPVRVVRHNDQPQVRVVRHVEPSPDHDDRPINVDQTFEPLNQPKKNANYHITKPPQRPKINEDLNEIISEIDKNEKIEMETPKPRESPQKLPKPEAIEIPIVTKTLKQSVQPQAIS